MRQYKADPAAAILTLADLLRREMEKSADAKYSSIMAMVRESMPDLKQWVELVKGDDGDDASPEQVAEALMGDKKFLESVKGDAGHTPTDSELVALIKPLIPPPLPPEHGKTPTEKQLLSLIRPLIPKVEDGETPSDGRLLSLIRPLIPKVKDGSPDKPKEIVAKLNETEEDVEPSVVKGLRRWMTYVEGALRELRAAKTGGGGKAGGGMGNVQHESNNVSSATTSVTTNYKIAGGGFAIMGVYYEGAFLVRGVGYTVGSDRKTLALLFTPEDSTHIDIVYIRS